MSKTLVIVESPTKAKTLKMFLGSEHVVAYSIGQVRDLPLWGTRQAPQMPLHGG